MRCYVQPTDWDRDEVTLSRDETHHLLHVMRAQSGHVIEVINGVGGYGTAEVVGAERKGARIRMINREQADRATPVITFVQALVREQKMDFIVQKAVELGAATIIPVETTNSVVRLPAGRAAAKKDRWDRIALGAAKQCGNPWLPEISEPGTLKAYLDQPTSHDVSLLCSLEAEAQSLKDVLGAASASQTVRVFIGPEGDFSPEETSALRQAGAIPVTLGDTVLRAETAAVYMLSVLHYALRD